jgi:hypothetical protein
MRTLRELALVAIFATGAAACAAPMRSVTHISSWSSEAGDYFYLAYAENEAVSRIKLCRILPDNAVSCVDQPEVDRLLNP